MIKTTLAALALTTAPLITMAPAQADSPTADYRPCMATSEARSTHTGMGRTLIEDRAEIKGLGRHTFVPFFGDVVVYPWCDHHGSNGDITQAWVGMKYWGDDDRVFSGFIVWYDCSWPGNECS